MRMTLDDVEKILNELCSAVTYAKEARREAKKVYSDDRAISQYLKYAHQDAQRALRRMEGEEP